MTGVICVSFASLDVCHHEVRHVVDVIDETLVLSSFLE